MVAVFLGFATEVDVVVKMLGVGMAVAILLDATVVRMVLVPGDHVAARPLELVAARAGSTGCCPTSTSRAPSSTPR